jgi:hypothetical protein
MKTSTLQKNFILFVSLILSTYSYATNVVNVPTAGQLSSILTQEQKDTITSLKITGFLDSDEIWWGDSDFYTLNNMPNLQHLDLYDVVVTNNKIPSSAFSDKTFLKSVVLPMNIKTIGNDAFSYCSSLSQVSFSEDIETIGSSAFYGCTSLSGSINFPSTLTTISDYAFYRCNRLAKISFSEGLQVIGRSAFSECYQLTGQIEFPSTIMNIGDYAFYSCGKLSSCKIKATTPPTLGGSTSLGFIKTVYVPITSASLYQNANYWTDKIIIDGDIPVSITLNITTPGTLGEKILEQFDYLRNINSLTVSGILNSTDFNYIKNDMVSLISVDMSGCINTELPDELFYNRDGLLEIKLPLGLKKMGTSCFYDCNALSAPEWPESLVEICIYAFYNCYNFRELQFPNSLKYIRNSAFENCTNISSIAFSNTLLTIENSAFRNNNSLIEAILPNSVTSIGGSAFRDCSSLENVSIPDHITTINSYTFSGCVALSSIILPSQLQILYDYAFNNCIKLTNLILPAGLITLYNPFSGCTGLEQVICLQPTPPVLSWDAFGGIDKSKCELLVPFWAETNYKLADYWKLFPNISIHTNELTYLPISGVLTLQPNALSLGNPTVELFTEAFLSVRENTVFNMTKYIQRQQLGYDWYWYDNIYSSLISETSSMRADSVMINIKAYSGSWYYFSIPFDANVSDIEITEGVLYAIRRYNGATRANIGAGNSWENVTESDILYANQGYIIQFNKEVDKFILKAINNENKNKIFTNETVKIALNEHVSEFEHNRSWNFIGNPYPCYFDISQIDYSAPITVRDGSSYLALSLTDDEYVLKPMQAFFIQKPVDVNEIIFNLSGRQSDENITTKSTLRSSSSRTLYNLAITNNDNADKTRIVINSSANMDYEIEKDASKFMSDDKSIPQLFSLDVNQTQYAINERPLGTGIIPLGFYAGESGDYTLSLNISGNERSQAILVDKFLKKETNLSLSDYTFNTSEGTFTNRFELRISNSVTSVENIDLKEVQIKIENGRILIETEIGSNISLISVAGLVLKDVKSVQNTTNFDVEQGIYILMINGKSYKIIVSK